MKFFNKAKGDRGEEIAANYLQGEGWKIVERNFSVKWGEIDIIASKEKVLAFVEVKSKASDKYGSPERMINKRKIMQINRIADLYIEKNKRFSKKFDAYRIDVVAIVMDDPPKINYYENVGAEFL